jgi:hypothetical protein
MTAFRPASFWIKGGLALGLIVAADLLLYDEGVMGAGTGVFGVAVVAAALIAHASLRRGGLGSLALLAAGVFAALQFERMTLLGLVLFAIAIGVAVLAPRAAKGDDAWRWAQRLAMAGLKAVLGPFKDFRRLLKARSRQPTWRIATLMLSALLPVAGGIIFLSLFLVANPVLSQVLNGLKLPGLDGGRLVFWGAVGGAAWAVLRPRGSRRLLPRLAARGGPDLPGVSPASVTASLLVFNAVFALQNGLDIAFLWSGTPLPKGVTLADYAHRGAYPLIVTALLAGLFVLVFLRPGSQTATRRWPRILVTAWVAQNLLLVASTALRTLDYIGAYSLTRLRIAALAWMALVAVGLALICWRLLRAKSASWLIDANVLAAGLALTTCAVVDLGAVAAAWNVRHAREVGGGGEPLDLCYMRQLGGSAVVALAELEQRPLSVEFRQRVGNVREASIDHLLAARLTWRGWTWRDTRRLARARALTAALPPYRWDGRPRDDCGAPVPMPRPAQLTAPPQPGT